MLKLTCQKNNCRKNSWDQYESRDYYNEWEDYYNEYGDYCDDERQRHVHEYTSNVKLAGEDDERHTHHISGVTGEAIPINHGRNHVHKVINDNTDFFDHYHQICDTTGPAIEIEGTGKHVHLLCGRTSRNDGHRHEYLFVTLIDAPLI